MQDPAHIFNWVRFNECVTTSGQPTVHEFDDIKALGISLVINLGMQAHTRALVAETAVLAHLGLRYIHIPVVFTAPTETDFAAFRKAMDGLSDGEMVHVHCIANYRVTAFLYRYYREKGVADTAHYRMLMERIWTPEGIWSEFIAAPSLPARP